MKTKIKMQNEIHMLYKNREKVRIKKNYVNH